MSDTQKVMLPYQKLLDGLTLIGQSLQEINASKEPLPINILVSKFVGILGLNNPEMVDELSLLRFAIQNEDPYLVKTSALVMGFSDEDTVGSTKPNGDSDES